MKKYLVLSLTLSLTTFLSIPYEDHQVVVIKVPVADCLGTAAQDIDPSQPAHTLYNSLAFYQDSGYYSCPRIHQCLYNEVGTICTEKDDEVLVEFPHFYYLSPDNERCSQFWVHKDSIIDLDTLAEHNLDHLIPEPITYHTKMIPHENILTLIHPWQDPDTAIWYSAGTRFIRYSKQDTPTRWGIIYSNYKDITAHIAQVPKHCALIELPSTRHDANILLLSLLRSWIYDAKNTIAYVWGGMSYIDRYTTEFSLTEEIRNTIPITNWQRPGEPGTRCGFDCSGLVLRLTQMVGIPYFCKNTSTIAKTFNVIAHHEPLNEGDLILYKGHVMIISDLEHHKLIDASSYPKGYGCLREVTLSQAFDEIETYQQLREWALLEKPLGIKDIHGNVITSAIGLKLLRIS